MQFLHSGKLFSDISVPDPVSSVHYRHLPYQVLPPVISHQFPVLLKKQLLLLHNPLFPDNYFQDPFFPVIYLPLSA